MPGPIVWLVRVPWFGQVSVASAVLLAAVLLLHCWLSTFLWSLCLILHVLVCTGGTFWAGWHAAHQLTAAQSPLKTESTLKRWHQLWSGSKTESLDEPEAPMLNTELWHLAERIVHDFVVPWYRMVGTLQEVPDEVRTMLESLLKGIAAQFGRMDRKQIGRKVLVAFHAHFQEYMRATRRATKRHKSLQSQFKYSHPAVKDVTELRAHLRRVCQVVMAVHGPVDLSQNSTASELLAAIMADRVFVPALKTVSGPVWLNQSILQLATMENIPVAKPPTVKSNGTAPAKVTNRNLTFSLPLTATPLPDNPTICGVLGNLIPAAAGPLLPVRAQFKPHKMWESPTALFPLDKPMLKCPSMPSIKFDAVSPCQEAAPRPILERSVSLAVLDGGAEDIEEASRSSSPELKTKESGARSPGHISPVYEEAEDFASTIAKLRALLEQRDSQQSLLSQSSQGSKSSPRSAGCESSDSNRQFTFAQQDSTSGSPREGSLDSERPTKLMDMPAGDSESSDSIDIVEASELPVEGRLFVNVTIPKTEVLMESGGGHYTVYCIQYDGIYMNESEQVDAGLVLHPVLIKRRFREFLALQTAIERNTTLRPLLDGIKGPTKWQNLPFSKMDQTTVSHRRRFLETYLQQVCSRQALAESEEMREFLAYSARSPPPFYRTHQYAPGVPRIDRLLAKTVTGMFHTLKTALPNFDSISPSTEALPGLAGGLPFLCPPPAPSPSTPSPTPTKDNNERRTFSQIFGVAPSRVENSGTVRTSFEKGTREGLDEVISQHLRNLESLRQALGEMDLPRADSRHIESSLLTVGQGEHRKESSESALEDEQDVLESELLLFTTLLNLVADMFPQQRNWQSQEFVITAVKVVLGRFLEEWLSNQCDALLCEEAQAQYLHRLRLLLWPESDADQDYVSDEAVTPEQLVQTVLKQVPVLTQWLLVPHHLREGVRLAVDILQHPTLTMDFALTVIDLLLAHCATLAD